MKFLNSHLILYFEVIRYTPTTTLKIPISFFSVISAQTYCAGDQISTNHQNLTHEVCAGYEDYETGDTFKLSDYNGELNGGNYHIIFIDMSASW